MSQQPAANEPAASATPFQDLQQTRNFLYLVLSAWSITLYLPFRSGSGKEHCGMRGFLGLLFPVVFFLCVPETSVLLIWPIYFVGLTIHRLGHLTAFLQGRIVHTQYSGYPWVALKLFPKLSEVQAKSMIEPLMSAVIGLILLAVLPGLGLYYLYGAAALFGKQQMDNWAVQKQRDQLNDARIESQYLRSQAGRLRPFG